MTGTEAATRLRALAAALERMPHVELAVSVRVVSPSPKRPPSRSVLRSRAYRARGGGQLRDLPFLHGATCAYCAVTLDLVNRRALNGATWDHVVPLSKGGTNDLENIVAACFRCNSTKRDRTPEQAGMVLR
jgi:5-methylcytosine-specific restriction endonuclease McrA